MLVIRPITLTSENMWSSVQENEYPDWESGLSPSVGQYILHNHHIWQYQGQDATNPEPGTETEVPLRWRDTGADNRWAMFDKKAGMTWLINKKTESPDPIEIRVTPGQVVNALGAVSVHANSVEIQLNDPVEGLVYQRTIMMIDTGSLNHYEYFFKPFERKENFSVVDLPAYGTAVLNVRFIGGTNSVSVGMLVIGQQSNIGYALYGSEVGFENYSINEIDDFGNETQTDRGSRDYVKFDISVPRNSVSTVKKLLRALKDTPSLYVGVEDREEIIIVGRCPKLELVLSNPALCECSLEILSLQ